MRALGRWPVPALFVSYLLVGTAAHAGCGANVCSARTGWGVQSVNDWREQGTLLDLRFEYIDQSRRRSGSHAAASGGQHHEEQYTLNRNALVTLDHGFAPGWGVSATLPILSRTHEHIHYHRGERLIERWDYTRPGDMRLLLRHHRAVDTGDDTDSAAWAFNAGLKLPTGTYELTNDDGDTAERSLQPGTGTTDLLVGAYYGRGFSEHGVDVFAQAGLQYAVDERSGYRPGDRWTLDAGARYGIGHRVEAFGQINLLWQRRDAGPDAEPDSTGGEFLYFNPGISYSFMRTAQLYALLQLPLYQRVNGVQLTAEHAVVVGMGKRF